MKALFTTLLAVVCMGVLIWGNLYWTDRTAVSVKAPEKTAVTVTPEKKMSPSEDLLNYTKNWPQEAIEGFKKAVEAKRPYHILIVGSKALGDEQAGWAALTKAKLIETYGEENIKTSIQVFDETSSNFVKNEGAAGIAEEQPGMVLFEPFTLNDNGEVSVADSLNNVQVVMNSVLESNPETVFILMPPHPIYDATFYPKQVAALKEYAQENNIPYLDHWVAWPDPKSVDVKEYLTSDNSQPNEKGHQLWSKFVADYLISK